MWNKSSKTSDKHFTSAQQAYDCALDLLSYRDYSDKELQERLQRKGADEEQARAATVKLNEYGILNEERYAQRVYEAWLAKRVYGRQHLQAELSKRGIRSELACSVLAQLTDELEAERAEAAAAIFLQRNAKKLAEADAHDRKLYAAAARFLAARGFSSRYMHVFLTNLQLDNDI